MKLCLKNSNHINIYILFKKKKLGLNAKISIFFKKKFKKLDTFFKIRIPLRLMNSIILILFSLYFNSSTPIQNLSDYNYPHPLSTSSLERIAIFATNDIHGHLIPDVNAIQLTDKTYRTGGATLMSSYIKSLRKEWQDHLVWLDAGDEYQGTMESNLFVGEPIVKFFNYMNLTNKTTAAIGNHDFDFGFKNMSKSFSEANFPYVSANVFNRSDDASWEFVNTYPDNIIQVGGLKVGVIGLTTIFTPQTTANDVSGLEFKDYVNITIEESRKLRNEGADIVLITCHVGVFCEEGDMADALSLKMRNKDTNQTSFCFKTDELYTFLEQIPQNVVDGVIGGHLHTIVHHWINEIPVVLGDCNARHFNVLYLTFDTENRRVLTNFTEIEGPVPVCENLIDETKTCFVNQSLVNLTNASFYNFTYHNEFIAEDSELRNIMTPYIDEAEKYKEMVLAYIENAMPIEAYSESALGDFISDAVVRATNAEFGLINRGMVRINWPIGNLTYYELYETIPFDDDVSTFEITGAEIWDVMSVLQNGSMAFYPTTGLKQYICKANKKLVNITTMNDEPLNLTKTYIVGANNFLIHGGDDFTQVLNFFTPRNIRSFENIRDAVAGYAGELKTLNSKENPIVDQMNPRIILLENCSEEEVLLNNAMTMKFLE